MNAFIYIFKNKTNNKCYVGQTTDIHKRYRDHIWCTTHDPIQPIHKAIAKYGVENFEFKVLEFLPDCTKEQLNEKEKYYIQKYQAYSKGYNCSLEGEGNLGLRHSEETKKLIGFKSRNRSPESNRRMREKLTGRKFEGEQLERMRKNLEENARPAAIEWHKSEEGLAWHKKQGEYLKGKNFRKLYKHTCIECGKEFETYGKRSKYCSGACEQRYRRKYLNKVTKICAYCGKPFQTDKYEKSKYCSPSCVNRAVRWGSKNDYQEI